VRFAKYVAIVGSIFRLAGASHSALAENDPMIRVVADARENSPKEDLRLSLFKTPIKVDCASVKATPRGQTDIDPTLNRFLADLLEALKKKNDKDLQPLFHPRLNVSLNTLSEILARMDNTYGAPLDTSVYRLWALNTIDGTPQVLKCIDDNVQVYAQYGYPLQFGVWLQIMGTKELGRIYLSLVPATGRWNIGGFHVQQWTHESKDAMAWMAEAEKDLSKGYTESAFAKIDVATKLADGGKLLEMTSYPDLVKKRDSIQSRQDWEKSIQSAIKPAKAIYTATLLVNGGAGILVRQGIDAEISVENIKKDCHQIATRLASQPWSKGLVGVRCGYNFPKEDPKTDGALGGIFIPFMEVASKK
jgi:hypothetical protein